MSRRRDSFDPRAFEGGCVLGDLKPGIKSVVWRCTKCGKLRSVVELNLENIDVFVVTSFHHIQPKTILHVRIVRVKVFDFMYSSTDGNRGKSLR